MRETLLLVSGALILVACSGGSTVDGDGGAGEGGSVVITTDGGTSTEGGAFRCTPGNYVFCRCSDRSEGTKECSADGQSFAPCATATGPCP